MTSGIDQAPGGLVLEAAACCICGRNDASDPIAVGEDFEYGTSRDSFVVFRCRRCDVRYLDPRPAPSELGRIYPPGYHAYQFTEENFGLAHTVRSKLEMRRLLDWCGDLPAGARILDVGAGDAFHLNLLRQANPGWHLEGVEPDERSVEAGRTKGITMHHGLVEELDLEAGSYDFAIMIMVVEHVHDPVGVLRAVRRLLKPGGRVGIVTDNARSIDAQFGRTRHWGGYHFPRHLNLFTESSLRLLAQQTRLDVERLTTMVSPVNWTYTVRNALVDWGAPPWLVDRFSLEAPGALALFTAVDSVMRLAGRGALLRAVLARPKE